MRQFCTIVIAFVVIAIAAGCTSTAEDALAKVMPPYCAKMNECIPDVFAKAYPNGESQCTAAGNGSLSSDDKNRQEACTNDEVDTCVADIKAMKCDVFTAWVSQVQASNDKSTPPPMPDSCKKC
jgi:hypothetical protein